MDKINAFPRGETPPLKKRDPGSGGAENVHAFVMQRLATDDPFWAHSAACLAEAMLEGALLMTSAELRQFIGRTKAGKALATAPEKMLSACVVAMGLAALGRHIDRVLILEDLPELPAGAGSES